MYATQPDPALEIQEGFSEEVTLERQSQGWTGWQFNKGGRETKFQMKERRWVLMFSLQYVKVEAVTV